MRGNSARLFSTGDFHALLDRLNKDLIAKINNLPEHKVLNVGSSILAKEFEEEFRLDVPKLKEDEAYVSDRETDVDISRDHRYIVTEWDPTHKKGIELTFHVPFEGDKNLFEYQPNAYTSLPPRAVVAEDELLFHFQAVDHEGDGEKIKNEYYRELSSVNQYLGWQRTQATEFNSKLNNQILEAIERRKQKLLKDRGLLASIGLPVRKRDKAPLTFVAPVARRVLPISRPNISNPYVPEPALEAVEYDHILNIVSQMVLVMERSPNAFRNMKEEDLRQHFLVQLNGHYEGQATGETFNYEGKTDILIRTNGKNIFIAECKYWTGEKGFAETIDQLLSYSSWRDTKTAIFFFNRNRDFSKMIEKIPPAASQHPHYVRQVPYAHQTGFRFVFSNRDDQTRELTVTILGFDIPQ